MENSTITEGGPVAVTQISLGAFLRIPAVRQITLLLGLAVSVAAGFAVVLWSQTPGYSRLYGGLDGADAAQVVESLRAADIDFKLNTDSGTVMVPESRLDDARLELASQGLPQGSSAGMAWLQEQSTFGQSQFRENALYQHALEAELARTIAHLRAVRDARVHLALPRQSAFIRDRKSASASVMLSLYRNRELGSDQAAAIVHLVASSVPNLLASNITVIDQQGQLLSSGEQQWNDAVTSNQFKFVERLERNYKRRIEDLLTPLLGPGRVRAEVAADLDFTVSEQARESFDPNGALISESVSNNQRRAGDSSAQGIPGALSNQPPQSGGPGAADTTQVSAASTAVDSASTSTRNFEVNRTVSHTQSPTGTIRRLSIAVLLDDTPVDTGDGVAPRSLTDADIGRFTLLVKEAVGFDESRGDTVVVVNAVFHPVPEAMPEAAQKIWEKPVVVDSLRMILGLILVLALAFGLVRPTLKNLLAANVEAASGGAGVFMPATAGQLAHGNSAIPPPSYDEKMLAAKRISGHDPAKVAQVVKKWVASTGT